MNIQKATTLFVIALLIGTSLASTASASLSTSAAEIWSLATENHGEFSRIIAYLVVLYAFVTGIQQDLSLNLRSYVVDNPAVTSSGVADVMGFFIVNVQIAYILAIVGTGIVMLLSSQSPKRRAQSKYMIGKLVIGFLLVTISPFVMQTLFSFSSSLTATIIDAEDPQVAADTFNELLFKCWTSSAAVLAPQILIDIGAHRVTHSIQHTAEHKYGRGASWINIIRGYKIVPKPDFTFPFLMTQMFFIFMLYGLLSLRLILIVTWAVLFPVTIFFTTFEPTKGIGRAMMEQTIFWTILQVFYAVAIDVIAIGFSTIPAGLDYFSLGTGVLSDLSLSFFTIGACLMFILTPLFTLSLYQRLT